jgi:hypothetical protein
LDALYREYKDQAQFILVYVREAHPSDGRQSGANRRDKVVYKTPKTLAERAKIASDCVKNLKLSMPCLLDDIDNTVQKQYQGWPARACIVDSSGKIVYASKPDPRGVNPQEIKKALLEELQGKGDEI